MTRLPTLPLSRSPFARTSRTTAFSLVVCLWALTWTAAAQDETTAEPTPEANAEEAPAWEAGDAELSANLDLELDHDGDGVPGEAPSGGLLLAGKIGGIASFNGLDPFIVGGLEAGWIFGALNRGLAAFLQVEYSAPPASGSVTEDFDPARVPGGAYSWELVQKQFVFQPTFMYRLTGISDTITPYAGIGPRLYLLETVVRGKADDQPIGDTFERSTKFGLGVPLGAELSLGPGGLFAEVLLQWGPLKHETTGKTHLGSGSLFLGYRLLL